MVKRKKITLGAGAKPCAPDFLPAELNGVRNSTFINAMKKKDPKAKLNKYIRGKDC